VSPDDPWGIAAFTGRSAGAAKVLAEQDGLFTLLVRAAEGDQAQLVSAISRAVDGADTDAFTACLADPAVRVLTLTVTEAGYCRREDGGLDTTEPFREWVLAGDFPGGRPAWEQEGALVVDDVTPYEQRKLWLLNGAHSILAYGGLLRGHATVADAIADETCRRWVDEWWDQASAHLCQPAPMLADYRERLLRRFANPRIRHLLSQIAMDGSQKLRVRVVPVLRRERAAGRPGGAALRVLACWIAYLRSAPADLHDPPVQRLRAQTRDMLSVLDSELAGESGLVADLDELVAELL
jgi:fructuronate reductase